MAEFNVGTVISTSVHEAYPGHYVQFLWTPQFPSTIRKLPSAPTPTSKAGPTTLSR